MRGEEEEGGGEGERGERRGRGRRRQRVRDIVRETYKMRRKEIYWNR